MQILMEHNWPGNVRELENVVERAVVLTTTPSVPAHVLPDHLQHASGHEDLARTAAVSLSRRLPVRNRCRLRTPQNHRRSEAANHSQTEAAEALRIPLSTLNQKIKRLNIDPKRRADNSD